MERGEGGGEGGGERRGDGEMRGWGDGEGNGACLSLLAGLILGELGRETCRSTQVFKAW